jgi:hypothetical protein
MPLLPLYQQYDCSIRVDACPSHCYYQLLYGHSDPMFEKEVPFNKEE